MGKKVKRMVALIVLMSIVLLTGCGEYTPPEKNYIKVTIKVKYNGTFGLVSDPICDVYIDNKKEYLAQASDSTITITTELEEGKHDIRIKTEDWGLTTGNQSNKIDFTVSSKEKNFSFTYEHTVLKGLKIWNNASTN